MLEHEHECIIERPEPARLVTATQPQSVSEGDYSAGMECSLVPNTSAFSEGHGSFK
jgi:hypothetical protein